MKMKRKIWKSIGAIILLLMFHVYAMAEPIERHFDGLDITINLDDGTALVSLSISGELSKNINYPGFIVSFLPWNQVHSIKFKSVNGASYSSADWDAIAPIINKASNNETNTLALDFSEIIIDDELFYFERVT